MSRPRCGPVEPSCSVGLPGSRALGRPHAVPTSCICREYLSNRRLERLGSQRSQPEDGSGIGPGGWRRSRLAGLSARVNGGGARFLCHSAGSSASHFSQGRCYRRGSLSPASAVSRAWDYRGSTDYLTVSELETSGARGIITAFTRILVSEPCQPLGLASAMLALAAGHPSPDFPAVHPICNHRSRGNGPAVKPCRGSIRAQEPPVQGVGVKVPSGLVQPVFYQELYTTVPPPLNKASNTGPPPPARVRAAVSAV